MQKMFSKTKWGSELNYICQRYITHNLPISDAKFKENYQKKVIEPLEMFNKYSKKECRKIYYEFGAGWNLLSVVGMSFFGFECKAIDISRLMQPNELNHTVQQYKKFKEEFGYKISQMQERCIFNRRNCISLLKEQFHIEFLAPYDARKTKFDDNSIDFISSNVVLEHVPSQDIDKILQECYRICKPGGVVYLSIDYQDHYSYFDKEIGIYNFLQFSEQEWNKYNSDLHYQNRLRHSDYVSKIKNARFSIYEVTEIYPTEKDIKSFQKIEIAEWFLKYKKKDLMIKSAQFVLGK